MTGRRVRPDREDYLPPLLPGDYGLFRGVWYAAAPNGLQCSLAKHEVIEHEDGTITVKPSILVKGTIEVNPEPLEWHGFLERGVWRSC